MSQLRLPERKARRFLLTKTTGTADSIRKGLKTPVDECDEEVINIQHRLVYQILEEEKIVKVIRMWTRYE